MPSMEDEPTTPGSVATQDQLNTIDDAAIDRILIHGIGSLFPECVARVPVSLGGLGVRLCSPSFAFAVATVRKCPQVSATACVSAVRLSTVASVSGVVPKACQVDSWSPQLYWCLRRRCLCDISVSPQLYWCLQRRCLCERSVSPQLYWCVQRRCL